MPSGTHASLGRLPRAEVSPIDDIHSEYYLNLEVADRPGVLHSVAGVFAEHGVSIRSMEQEGLGDAARIIFITHMAREVSVDACLYGLRALSAVRRVVSVLRVIGSAS